jgi:hypothetical protein
MKKVFIIELILLFTIFYLIKYVPEYRNTILILRNDIKIEREEPFESDEEDLFLLKKDTYVKEISNINGIWVGKTYSYDELKEMSLSFRNLINEKGLKKEKYDKETGYFIIEPNREFYSLSEEEVKKKLNTDNLKLKSIESYMKKFGQKPIFTTFYQRYLSNIRFTKSNLPFYKENVEDENFEEREIGYMILFRNIMLFILIVNFCSYPYLLRKNRLKIDLNKIILIIVFFFTDSIVLILSILFTKPWDYIDIEYFPLYIIFHIIFRNITTAFYFLKIEKVLRKFKDIPKNDIIEKIKMNEEIMSKEFTIFLSVKIFLLYLAPMLLVLILSIVDTALTTFFYFIIYFFSLLYCFYSFIVIEDNLLNSAYDISIYLLQYILFLFIVLYF